jgi:small subunit ribosomal protein S8
MSLVTTDPIADMLTRIRNGILVNHNETSVPYSRIKENILKILRETNFIDDYLIEDNGLTNKKLIIKINALHQKSRLNELKRISKPGRRVYLNYKDIPSVKQGRGFLIISTSKGLMTSIQAKEQQVGGEVICQIY